MPGTTLSTPENKNGGLLPTDPIPDDAPGWVPPGAIPPHVRDLNRYFHTDDWWPGDVLLTRHINPGFLPKQIQRFQEDGGYSAADAQWTHAAIYLGDGLNVCEAIVGSRFWKGEVTVSSLSKYVGSHGLRLRRSLELHDDKELGWRLAVQALSQLGKPYDIGSVVGFARKIRKEHGFWAAQVRARISSKSARICSTLFSDAHNAVTGVTIGERTNGICVPAFLSQSDSLQDVDIRWARLNAG